MFLMIDVDDNVITRLIADTKLECYRKIILQLVYRVNNSDYTRETQYISI